MEKKKFVAVALDPEYKTFIIYVAFLSFTLLNADLHPSHKTQIASLITKEASTKIFADYADFIDVFSLDLTSKLFEYTRINDHAIKLVDN